MAINVIDVFLVIVIALSLLNGIRRGFVHGVLDLLGWLVALIAGLRYYQQIASFLRPMDLWSEVWDQPIAFVLVALTAGIIVQVIGYWLLKRLPENIHEHQIN